jgi:hypothetical protein
MKFKKFIPACPHGPQCLKLNCRVPTPSVAVALAPLPAIPMSVHLFSSPSYPGPPPLGSVLPRAPTACRPSTGRRRPSLHWPASSRRTTAAYPPRAGPVPPLPDCPGRLRPPSPGPGHHRRPLKVFFSSLL